MLYGNHHGLSVLHLMHLSLVNKKRYKVKIEILNISNNNRQHKHIRNITHLGVQFRIVVLLSLGSF